MKEFDHLVRRAEAGDTSAQRDLAIRLHQGDGVAQDLPASALWLRRAALGGDAWAQTTLAIVLRGSKRREDEVEAVGWLRKAVEQGDARAQLTLGLHEFLGIGTPVDKISGAVHVLSSSLAGYDDSKTLFSSYRAELSPEEIGNVYERTRWPIFSIFLGPNPPGHLSAIFDLTDEERRGSKKLDRLMEYEKQNADALFGGESILRIAYKQNVSIESYLVAQSIVDGKFATTFSINTRNIRLTDGSPAYWRPSDKDLNDFMTAVQMIEMRTWLRWVWASF